MSTISITGKVERSPMGSGAWALVSTDGQTYELKGAPKEMLQSGLRVQVEGTIRDDVMSIAMIGPVLEVQRFQAT